jgi:hypothetical protein
MRESKMMKRTLVNIAVVVPSLLVAFVLGARCGDLRRDCVGHGRTIAQGSRENTLVDMMFGAEALTNTAKRCGQVGYQIEWDQDKASFLVNGQSLEKDKLASAHWRNASMASSNGRRFRIETPTEPPVVNWNTAYTEIMRSDAKTYDMQRESVFRDGPIQQTTAKEPLSIATGGEKVEHKSGSWSGPRVLNSFNSPLDRGDFLTVLRR